MSSQGISYTDIRNKSVMFHVGSLILYLQNILCSNSKSYFLQNSNFTFHCLFPTPQNIVVNAQMRAIFIYLYVYFHHEKH